MYAMIEHLVFPLREDTGKSKCVEIMMNMYKLVSVAPMDSLPEERSSASTTSRTAF